jgi:hypothetical protein
MARCAAATQVYGVSETFRQGARAHQILSAEKPLVALQQLALVFCEVHRGALQNAYDAKCLA